MAAVVRCRLLVRPTSRMHASARSAARSVRGSVLQRPSRPFHRCSAAAPVVDSAAPTSSSTASPPLPPPSSSQPTPVSSQQPRSPQPSSPPRSTSDVLGIVLFLGLSGVTLCLGTWQLQRKQWKEKLMVERAEALKGTAIDLNTLLQQQSLHTGNDWHTVPEFQRVSASGTFDYSAQVKVGPRPAPASSTALSGQGFYVITPINVNGQTLLVNRGWIDRKHADPIPQEITTEHEAVTHHPEKTPAFIGSYDPATNGSYIAIDAAHIAQRLSLPTPSPLLIDLITPSPAPHLLTRRPLDTYLTFATTPLIHTVYAVTWYALALAGVVGTYVRFRRGRGGPGGAQVRRVRQVERRV